MHKVSLSFEKEGKYGTCSGTNLLINVQSLKYEIWASTDLGNKRLDRAFRESADKGPIYLFFSVNGR